MADCFGQKTLLRKSKAKVEMGLVVIRVEAQVFPIFLDGLLWLVLGLENIAQVVVCASVARMVTNSFAKLVDGLVVLMPISQSNAEVDPGIGMVGCLLQHNPVLRNGLIEPATLCKRNPESKADSVELGPEPQGGFVIGYGLRKLP